MVRGSAVAAASLGTVVVSSTASDSHTWNLVYLELLIRELGYDVVNLGPCVPDELLAEHCREIQPVLVVISSVNGHGHQDGLRVIKQLRGCARLRATPVVIGGKLGIAAGLDDAQVRELMAAGFDMVFQEGADAGEFRRFVGAIPRPAAWLPDGVGAWV
ncbi:methylaspartate mutase [Amycolatopsis sp. WAC 01375]|nr:methylaspartate mutase [Amycolatopsis sp. WAC 01375]RSN34621.1 methylaspartate mutase [Amycolatopsis sp. WAC 01416]